MPTTFGWLHFTDLHRGTTSQKGWWSDWEDKLFRDLRARHTHTGPWDLVLFTGDLTDRGTAAQFDQLDGFLAKLWGLFDELQPGVPVGLLAVPGNHDLQRPDPEKKAEDAEFHAELTVLADWAKYARMQDKFWSDASSRYRRVIDRAFADYRAWWDRQAVGKHAGLKRRAGNLPGDFAATLEKEGARIGVVGLNSAFLQLAGGDYKGRLALDYRQFDGACGKSGPDWAGEHQLCLLLTHHPADWLSGEGQQALGRILGDRFALHLHGHMHETAYRALSVGGGPMRRTWQGISLFGEEGWEGGKADRRFGYAIGRVELREKDGSLRIWPRKAPPPRQDGGWELGPDQEACRIDEGHQNATHPELLPLLRTLPAAVAAPPAKPPPAASPATAPAPRDPRRFAVLLLSTDLDLASARADVASYLDRAYGVEVAAGPAGAEVDPAGFDLVLLFQGQRWEEGRAAGVWDQAPAAGRVALVSDPEGDWPPLRLVERRALDKVDALRERLTGAVKFADPRDLPEKVGVLVAEAMAAQGNGSDIGLQPWERAYLAYSIDVWRGGRTTGSRSYLLDSAAREEPYVPELYTALDGTSVGWEKAPGGEPVQRAPRAGKRVVEYEDGGRVALARFLSCPEFARIALVGAPGAGKTVFLTRIAASLASACMGRTGELEKNLDLNALRSSSGTLPIPVVLEATRLARHDLDRGLEALLYVVAEELAKGGQAAPSIDTVREGLEQGRYFVLVDALDEIADAERRRRVLELLRGMGQAACFPRTRLAITTRSAAYTGDLHFGGLGVVQVAPLSEEQTRAFCAQWSRHRRRDDAFGDDLQQAVNGLAVPGARDEPSLTSNPLMLTAICLVYEKHRTLPNDRGRLCELMVDDLCRSRRSEDQERGWQLDEAGKMRLLQRIALAMQEEGAQSWPESRAVSEIRETLPLGEAQPELRAARHLQWITEHTGLVRFEGQGETEQIRFWHRLFREYLAARELAQGDRKVRELVQDLWEKGRLREPFWQDVIRLLPRVLGTPEKAQALAQELEALAAGRPEARGRLLGLAAAGMIESRELFPGVDFGEKARALGRVYEGESARWPGWDRFLVLNGLAELDPVGGDPRCRAERWVSFPGGDVVLGDTAGDLVKAKCGAPARSVQVQPFAMAWAPVTVAEYLRFFRSDQYTDRRLWDHAPRDYYNKEIVTPARRDQKSLALRGWSTGISTQLLTEVSFYEALAYCRWCTGTRTDARIVRLMTEAEWEYVCRSVGGAYPWGGDSPSETNDWTQMGWGGVGHSRFGQIGFLPLVAGVADIVNYPQWCDSTYDAPYGLRATQKAKAHGGVVAPSWNLVTRGASSSGPGGVGQSLRCAYRARELASGDAAIRLVLEAPP